MAAGARSGGGPAGVPWEGGSTGMATVVAGGDQAAAAGDPGDPGDRCAGVYPTGAWQLDRAQIRGDQAAQLEQAERESAAPVPLTDVVPPQTQLTQEMVGTRVLAEGIY